MLKNETLVFII